MSDRQIDHLDETVRRMADLHAEHASKTTWLQHAVVRITCFIADPVIVTSALAVVLAWVGYNAAAPHLGWRPFDPYPFSLLTAAATVTALFTTVLILATQRREEEFTRRRSRLTLQLAVLSEEKVAKVIGLLEEQRRESPLLSSRPDAQAEQMANPTDAREVLDRIDQAHAPFD